MTTTLAPTSAILEPQSPEMTKAEIAAIRTLRRLAKRWPNTLWLASMSGTLSVMRTSVNRGADVSPPQTGRVRGWFECQLQSSDHSNT